MKALNQIIADATAAVGAEYFQLPILDDDSVYRERVYCYELYHQMRSRWPSPDDEPLRLTGEVDKSGHAVLRAQGVNGEKPDLLVHRPGYGVNHALIEVKHSEAAAAGIKKDLTTLRLFKNQVGYDRAIYLIYGHKADAHFVGRVRLTALELGECGGIEIWLHAQVHHGADLVETL